MRARASKVEARHLREAGLPPICHGRLNRPAMFPPPKRNVATGLPALAFLAADSCDCGRAAGRVSSRKRYPRQRARVVTSGSAASDDAPTTAHGVRKPWWRAASRAGWIGRKAMAVRDAAT